jgi:hypothetical protein
MLSLLIMAVYLTLAFPILIKYRPLMDAFMKANIGTYLFAFTAKPLFWFISYRLDIYNKSIHKWVQQEPLIPIDSPFGAVISAMSFLILHILIIRIVLAYYNLMAKSQ